MAGRPPKYKSVQDIQTAIDSYFEACKGEILKDNDGNPMINKFGQAVYINQKVPTVNGLALALGFASRQSLLEYQGKKQFTDTITRAKTMIEEYVETRLFDRDGAKGAEFSLRCNFRWSDKQSDIENEKEKLDAANKIIVSIRKTASEASSHGD